MSISSIFKGATSLIPGAEMTKNLIVVGLVLFLLYAVNNTLSGFFSWDRWFGPTKEEIQAQSEEHKKAKKALEGKVIVLENEAMTNEAVKDVSDQVVEQVRKKDAKTVVATKKAVKKVETKLQEIRMDNTMTEKEKHIQESQLIYDTLTSAASQVTQGATAPVSDADVLASLG